MISKLKRHDFGDFTFITDNPYVINVNIICQYIYGSGHRKMYNWGWTGKNNKTHNYFKQLYYT